MHFHYYEPHTQALRDKPFYLMRDQGLLPYAMSSIAHPTLSLWRSISAQEQGHLLLCEDGKGTLLGCALFSPFRGRVWECDVTGFRAGFAHAVAMAQGGMAWAFQHLDCAALLSLCPRPNRHAWRIAPACGFVMRGILPDALWWAAKNCFVPAFELVASPQSLEQAQSLCHKQ
jgi:RimJ/RimL family protein N-acetyltransferase